MWTFLPVLALSPALAWQGGWEEKLLMMVRGYFEFLVSGAFLTVGELVTVNCILKFILPNYKLQPL